MPPPILDSNHFCAMKIIKLFLPFCLTAFLSFTATARECVITSPNGQLTVKVSDKGGIVTYSATHQGGQVILPSALGFKANFGDFTQGLKIVSMKNDHIDRSYQMYQTKQRDYHFVATQTDIEVENGQQQHMTIQLCIDDNDVAFRYLIPLQKDEVPRCAVILSEASSFRFPDGSTTFLTPQSKDQAGWARTKPSYEEEYIADAPMTASSLFGQGFTFPCLFKASTTEGTRWVLISETGVSSQYCGSHLSDYSTAQEDTEKGGAYTIAFPMPGENNGVGSTTPAISLPGATPWRTITIGATLKPIVEATIQYDLVEPLYTSNVESPYGRYTWSWLLWQDESMNWNDQKLFIDLAATMGYEYCLVDALWDTQIGRERIPELVNYAQSKGVSLLFWYNSNGAWNDTPQTPRNCMNTAAARDREMAWLQRIGVKGIKVDFFGGDKQETMKLYEDILTDANRYGLQVIFHGCTIPRGWERMYPNFVSSEAVLASENVYFEKHHAEQEAFQLCMLPFSRNAVGTMDWGGVMMNRYLSRDNKSRHQRQTTDVFEIASAFTNQAAIQCIAIQPNNLNELPQVEIDFLKTIPTTWDETCFIDGYPGRYVVMARRHGNQWYVAGLNALKEKLTLTLSLPMFAVDQSLTLLCDQVNKKTGSVTTLRRTAKLDKHGQLKVTLQPNGGVVIY